MSDFKNCIIQQSSSTNQQSLQSIIKTCNNMYPNSNNADTCKDLPTNFQQVCADFFNIANASTTFGQYNTVDQYKKQVNRPNH